MWEQSGAGAPRGFGVGGATLDYGPFGFIERFEANWAMWIGGGQHFSFANQPRAAGVNLRMWLQALEPLLDRLVDAEVLLRPSASA